MLILQKKSYFNVRNADPVKFYTKDINEAILTFFYIIPRIFRIAIITFQKTCVTGSLTY